MCVSGRGSGSGTGSGGGGGSTGGHNGAKVGGWDSGRGREMGLCHVRLEPAAMAVWQSVVVTAVGPMLLPSLVAKRNDS